MNVADFYDPKIDEKMAALEKEEDELVRVWEAQKKSEENDGDTDSELDEETLELARTIKDAKKGVAAANALNKSNGKPVLPRKYRVRQLEDVTDALSQLGLDTTKLRSRSRDVQAAARKKRARSRDTEMAMRDDKKGGGSAAMMDEDKGVTKSTARRGRSREPRPTGGKEKSGLAEVDPSTMTPLEKLRRHYSRSHSRARTPNEVGFRNVKQRLEAQRLGRSKSRPRHSKDTGRLGESDRFVGTKMPKHLFSGKRGIGSADHR